MNASSDYQRNIDEDNPETPYEGENINQYYNNEGNNDDVAPAPPTNDISINTNSDYEKNDYEITPDTPTNGGKMKKMTMAEKKRRRD